MHAGHAGQTPEQDRDKATNTNASQAVSGSRKACHNCAVTQAGGGDDLLCSIEEQSGDIQKVLLSCALPTHHTHRLDNCLPLRYILPSYLVLVLHKYYILH